MFAIAKQSSLLNETLNRAPKKVLRHCDLVEFAKIWREEVQIKIKKGAA
jgi:hypothetical protein